MKKGKVLLNALIVMRKLKPICNAYEISYKYWHQQIKIHPGLL